MLSLTTISVTKMIEFYVKWSRMMKGVKIRLIVGFGAVF